MKNLEKWYYQAYVRGNEEFYVISDQDEGVVANTSIRNHRTAALLAAAPQLYRACKKALRLCECNRPSRPCQRCVVLAKATSKVRDSDPEESSL